MSIYDYNTVQCIHINMQIMINDLYIFQKLRVQHKKLMTLFMFSENTQYTHITISGRTVEGSNNNMLCDGN